MGSRVGPHRSPISSEKCWLDFAVRELSRVAAGKAKGQEAVWRDSCKPKWWDSVCPYPWKNPTANGKDGKEGKDGKDVLKTKFECLVKHLRGVGQVPREMEEEIALWEAGQVQELFLLTSVSFMLGQVGSVQRELDSVLRKVEETRVSVDPSILTDLHTSLSACLAKINMLRDRDNKSKSASKSTPISLKSNISLPISKRKRDEQISFIPTSNRNFGLQVSGSPSPSKRPKKEPRSICTNTAAQVDSPLPSSSQCRPWVSPSLNAPSEPEQQKVVETATMQKLLLQLSKRKSISHSVTKNVLKSEANEDSMSNADVLTHSVPLENSVRVLTAHSVIENVTVPPTASYEINERTELGDFLELDLAGKDDLSTDHFDFYDRLLEENSPTLSPEPASSTTYSLTPDAQDSEVDLLALETEPDFPPPLVPDPLWCHSSTTFDCTNITEKLMSPLNIMVDSDTVSQNLGEIVTVNDRDMVLDQDVVSDSGYETSSPTSLRSSLDLIDTGICNETDLSSPDLEALLDRFPV